MTTQETFDATWDTLREEVNTALDAALRPRRDLDPTLLEIMRYATLGGGKRVRPVLCLATCEAAGGQREHALPAACALEMLHAYSLVHDDMPCMDDDDERRGQPTVHRKWDEATAVLVGDALQAEAFLQVSDRRKWPETSPEAQLQVAREVAACVSASGMVGGQYIDITARSRRLDRAGVETLHRLKTGALIQSAAVCGGVVAGATPLEVAALSRFGASLGQLFQLVDDLLDAKELEAAGGIEANPEEAAVNFYTLLGEDALRAAIDETADNARNAVDVFAPRDEFLRLFVDKMATRTA